MLCHILQRALGPFCVNLKLECLGSADRAARTGGPTVTVVAAKRVAVEVRTVRPGAIVTEAVTKPVVRPAGWVRRSCYAKTRGYSSLAVPVSKGAIEEQR